MTERNYRNQRWSEEEIRLLCQMAASGKSLTLMTAKLKRPMASILARAADLHICISGTSIGNRRK
jgi:hypothetical protein